MVRGEGEGGKLDPPTSATYTHELALEPTGWAWSPPSPPPPMDKKDSPASSNMEDDSSREGRVDCSDDDRTTASN